MSATKEWTCATSLEGRTSLQKTTIPGACGGVGGDEGKRGPAPSSLSFCSLGLSSAPRQDVLGRSRSPGGLRDGFEVVEVVVVEEERGLGSRLPEAAAAAVASRNLVTSFIPSLRRRLTMSLLGPPGVVGEAGRGRSTARCDFFRSKDSCIYVQFLLQWALPLVQALFEDDWFYMTQAKGKANDSQQVSCTYTAQGSTVFLQH